MPDPFLLAHYCAPLIFDISTGLTPVAIRDQMVRGRMIIDRAREESLIGPGRPILVVGAGIAGVVAALRAADYQVPTVLIDQAPNAFNRQATCRSRWIDPVQYDWPLDHWTRGEYPWMQPAQPLHFTSERANSLAIHWERVLAQAQVRAPHLLVNFQATVNWPPILVGPFVTATFRCLRGQRRFPPRNFGMILFATGFGHERSTVGRYSGFRFWDDDPLEQANLGTKLDDPRILISGGGDGALQDFLRIVTGRPSARAIFEHILDRGDRGLSLLRERLERRLQCVEDQAQRAYTWGARPAHDHAVLEWSHEEYRQNADAALRDGGSNLSVRLEQVILSPARQLTHCFPCTHFGQCYALNRFLTLLIGSYLESKGQAIFLPRTETVRVYGIGNHACANSPIVCHGEPHEVELRPVAGDCTMTQSGSSVVQQYDVIIVRHGIQPPKLHTQLTNGTTISRPRPRQILPYYSPA